MSMPSILDLACGHPQGPRAPCLLVMLPGAYDTPDDFLREGFVSALREQGLDVDVQLVDAHVSQYMAQTVLGSLRDEVITPAREAGYQQIWLLGISIGGMGALLYGATFPGEVHGVVALAPYLGPRHISMGVERAGGLSQWPSVAQPLPDDPTDSQLWCWLKGLPEAQAKGQPWPVFWAYGHADRFAHGHRLVGASLPAAQVYTVDGGHDWPTWRALWGQMLGQLPLPRLRKQPAGS